MRLTHIIIIVNRNEEEILELFSSSYKLKEHPYFPNKNDNFVEFLIILNMPSAVLNYPDLIHPSIKTIKVKREP